MLDGKNLPQGSVVCLMAPTASGKTDLAFALDKTGRFELISVDSALIYRDMNIGTAKPTAEELACHTHHLVDIVDPTETYSVAQFADDARRLIDAIHARGKIPLLVGGTMMYYMALFEGLSSVPQSDEATRAFVKQWQKKDGNEALYAYLKKGDPEICQRLKPSDTQRITRAVEVLVQTGKSLSDWQKTPRRPLCANPKQTWYGLCLSPDRAWLHARIARRLDLMWEQGFVEEVLFLLQKYPDLRADSPAMRSVGYRQVLEYLAAVCHPIAKSHALFALGDEILATKTPQNAINACQEMKNKALYATRQLAKRQYTWLRRLSHSDNLTIIPFASIQQVEQRFL